MSRCAPTDTTLTLAPSRMHPWLARALALAAPALAADGLAAQGFLRDGNASYRVRTISAAQHDSVDCDFTADPAFVTDALTEEWWYYRMEFDADERAFRDDGTLTQRYAGRHGDLFWSDVDSRGLFRAHVGLALFSTGPRNAKLYNRLTVFNLTAQPLRMSLYHYLDVNMCGYSGHNATGSGPLHYVEGNCTGQQLAVEVLDAARYEVRLRDDTECGILDYGPATLSNSGLPFHSGDYTSAAQWNIVLPPGQQFTAWVSLEHNPGSCPQAQTENYGFGRPGTLGIPTISSGLPRMGGLTSLRIANSIPNTGGVLAFGFGRAEFPIGPLQLQVLGGPRGIDFDSIVVRTDQNGEVNLRVLVPTLEEFCARQINFQCFLLDPGAPPPIPFSHTDALEWLVGG